MILPIFSIPSKWLLRKYENGLYSVILKDDDSLRNENANAWKQMKDDIYNHGISLTRIYLYFCLCVVCVFKQTVLSKWIPVLFSALKWSLTQINNSNERRYGNWTILITYCGLVKVVSSFRKLKFMVTSWSY